MTWTCRCSERGKEGHVHMIARCTQCGLEYDIDFEPAKDCGHPDEMWTVDLRGDES